MRTALALSLCIAASGAFAETEIRNPLLDQGSWPDLREDVLGDLTITAQTGVFTVDAPYRAHDAATVPIEIAQPGAEAPRIHRATIVVDENPAPVVAEIDYGPAMHPLSMELRVRVNQYSNLRVIAETDAGAFMQGRFIKASGGCSAPATKDPALALANMGKMRLKHFGDVPQMSNQRREAQIMIRHPNYSGLQRDQITQLFIQAHFIDTLEVRQGEDLLFRMEGGISISENPVFRFGYTDNGSETLTIRATDTDGNVFQEVLPKNATG